MPIVFSENPLAPSCCVTYSMSLLCRLPVSGSVRASSLICSAAVLLAERGERQRQREREEEEKWKWKGTKRGFCGIQGRTRRQSPQKERKNKRHRIGEKQRDKEKDKETQRKKESKSMKNNFCLTINCGSFRCSNTTNPITSLWGRQVL